MSSSYNDFLERQKNAENKKNEKRQALLESVKDYNPPGASEPPTEDEYLALDRLQEESRRRRAAAAKLQAQAQVPVPMEIDDTADDDMNYLTADTSELNITEKGGRRKRRKTGKKRKSSGKRRRSTKRRSSRKRRHTKRRR